ncbi:MAG: polyamine aminopropyltransferase [Clostridia bacterium]
MELWFTEQQDEDVKFSIKVDRPILSTQSKYQRIDIFSSKEFGKVLVLDGCLMVTEKDEYIYHEMITHTALSVNPEIKSVLVIGGGDGGTVRELCKYHTIERIDLVEIDADVVKYSKEHLQFTACSLDDPRVSIYIEDGLPFVRKKTGEYDLIIVDSTDPFGPGESLFTKEFYGNCHNALTDDGILINQHESTFYKSYRDEMERTHRKIASIFEIAKVFQAHIPTYPSGHWLFGFASKKYHPINDFKPEMFKKTGIKTKYYNEWLHKGSFYLPNNVKECLELDE